MNFNIERYIKNNIWKQIIVLSEREGEGGGGEEGEKERNNGVKNKK